MLKAPYGILPAMITPRAKDGKVNYVVLRQLIDHLIEGGVHGIFAVGTTGEFYSLNDSEYREILETAVDQVAGRTPVYAGANSIGTRECIHLVDIATKVKGIDAISVLTPYFIGLSQQELYNHYAAIAGSTDLGIIMYDNAPKTHLTIQTDTVAKLADIPNIIAIKDSTGDMSHTADILNNTKGKEFKVMMGRDSLIHSALSYGASGAVAATANIAPKLVSDIYNKYMSGDIQGSLEDQYKLLPLRLAFNIGSFPAVIKEGLEMIGIAAGPCALPTGPLDDAQRAKLRSVLKGMDLL